MKIKIKNVYYCDFCKKKSMKKNSIELHEKHCTMNPNRECRVCGRISILPFIEKWKRAKEEVEKEMPKRESINGELYTELMERINYTKILEDVGFCPTCTLAVMRIAGLSKFPFGVGFDYKKEQNDWWIEKNERERYNLEL